MQLSSEIGATRRPFVFAPVFCPVWQDYHDAFQKGFGK
jgi:hypothetical protein